MLGGQFANEDRPATCRRINYVVQEPLISKMLIETAPEVPCKTDVERLDDGTSEATENVYTSSIRHSAQCGALVWP